MGMKAAASTNAMASHGGASASVTTSISKPASMNSHPPNRCVRSHTASLASVHGVRMPMKKFLRSLPM